MIFLTTPTTLTAPAAVPFALAETALFTASTPTQPSKKGETVSMTTYKYLRYLRYYLKNTLQILIFSPLIIGFLFIGLCITFFTWLHYNPHPTQTEEEYENEKARNSYYPPF